MALTVRYSHSTPLRYYTYIDLYDYFAAQYSGLVYVVPTLPSGVAYMSVDIRVIGYDTSGTGWSWTIHRFDTREAIGVFVPIPSYEDLPSHFDVARGVFLNVCASWYSASGSLLGEEAAEERAIIGKYGGGLVPTGDDWEHGDLAPMVGKYTYVRYQIPPPSADFPGDPLTFHQQTTLVIGGKSITFAEGAWATTRIYRDGDSPEDAISISEAISRGWIASSSYEYIGLPMLNYPSQYVGYRAYSYLWGQRAGKYHLYYQYVRYPTAEELQETSLINPVEISIIPQRTSTVTLIFYSGLTVSTAVSSVTPAEFQEGNADPLGGTPPYVVTLADTSTRGKYTIPVQAVTIDWGDVDSGTQNVITLTDIGNNPFPEQTHTYTGYGPYTIRVSWTDMRGNISEATTYFEADPTPRLIKPPEVEPLEGYQPLLVTGRAHVAGKPTPEVEWTYSLQDADYTGSKTGEYIELSLLKAGTYDFRCTTRDNGIVIDETVWEITVEPKPIYPDAPVAANNLDVWVFQNGERVDLIQPPKIQFTQRHARPSFCEFTAPPDYSFAEALLPGGEIAVGYLGRAILCRIESYDENPDGSITITAMDAASVALQNRVATVATRSTIGNGYDCQTAPAESLMRYFAEANLGLTPPEAVRAIPRMRVVGADSGRGGIYTYSARYEDVLSIIEDICASSGLGWDSSLQSDSEVVFSFKVVEGVDRTVDSDNPILFTGRPGSAHTAKVGAYTAFRAPNVAITAGAGDGDTRDYAEYGDTDATDLDRWEQFVDAGDAADEDEMHRMGELGLLKHEGQNIVVYPGEQYRLGRDYYVGDFVSVETNSGILLRSLQITQARMNKDDTGVHVELECGSDLRGYQRLIREQELANTYARK